MATSGSVANAKRGAGRSTTRPWVGERTSPTRERAMSLIIIVVALTSVGLLLVENRISALVCCAPRTSAGPPGRELRCGDDAFANFTPVLLTFARDLPTLSPPTP